MKNQITLVEPTTERNGVIVKRTVNNVNSNSVELRKVSVSGRDNGHIASIALSTGNIIFSGSSWRGKGVNSPVPEINLQSLVDEKINLIKNL